MIDPRVQKMGLVCSYEDTCELFMEDAEDAENQKAYRCKACQRATQPEETLVTFR
jgi:hypothetical protein